MSRPPCGSIVSTNGNGHSCTSHCHKNNLFRPNRQFFRRGREIDVVAFCRSRHPVLQCITPIKWKVAIVNMRNYTSGGGSERQTDTGKRRRRVRRRPVYRFTAVERGPISPWWRWSLHRPTPALCPLYGSAAAAAAVRSNQSTVALRGRLYSPTDDYNLLRVSYEHRAEI